MTAPAHGDQIGVESLCFVENAFDRSLIDNDRFRARPSSCQRMARLRGTLVRAPIERRQQNRAAIRSATLPCNDRTNACLGRPWHREDSRNGRTGLRGSVGRHHDAKIGCSCHLIGRAVAWTKAAPHSNSRIREFALARPSVCNFICPTVINPRASWKALESEHRVRASCAEHDSASRQSGPHCGYVM